MSELIDETAMIKKSKFGPNRFITDIIFNILLGLAILSFLFKFMHWPGGGLGMALVAFLSLMLVIGQLIEGIIRKNASRTLLVISGSLLLVFFAFRLQYWPDAESVFIFTALLFITGLIIHFVKKQQFSVKHWMIISMAGLALFLSRVEASSLYYHVNLSETFHGDVRDHAYMGWRQYSRILYAEGKKEEALKSIDKAISILESMGADENDWELAQMKNERLFMSMGPLESLDDLSKNLR